MLSHDSHAFQAPQERLGIAIHPDVEIGELIFGQSERLGGDDLSAIEDDHMPFVRAGVPAIDLIDFDYPPWHTDQDTIDKVSARSLQVVGDVLLAVLQRLE